MTLEELKKRILAECDPDEVVEELDISTEDLIEAFEDRLEDRKFRFLEFEDDE